MTYETQEMEMVLVHKFASWFDSAIGTDREINETEMGRGYLVAFELERDEVAQCQEYENTNF